ncbi:IS66 family insertion sequence element accessory protein TnpA [Lawsonibacter sp. LCP25S3_G6]|uniref:IS66 family insertion sequence element accessory protein TnpA n=1 Tax=unclassified Lawsonibacter TaxID=2617946 RepID=UPI003F951D38
MQITENLQIANQWHRLVEWSRRVEACRSSGMPVGRWCQEHGIAVSTYFPWQRKVFQALKEVQEVTFAEVPVMEHPQLCERIAAAMEVSDVRIQVYAGADEATLLAILRVAKSC